jgi:hypothetical protein
VKQGGLGQVVMLDGYDLSGDIQSYTLSGGKAPIEVTGVDKRAFERIFGRRDGQMAAVTYFNPGTDRAHELLSPLPLTDRIFTIADPDSGQAWALVGKQISYDPNLTTDGALTCNVAAQANGYGIEHGDLLTIAGQATRTGAGAESAVDFLVPTAFGAQAYLQVTAFTGTDCTLAVQSSSDNGVGDAWANVPGLVFAATTAARTAQRVETARTATIERYLRVNATTTGGFSSITFKVLVVKNEAEVTF